MSAMVNLEIPWINIMSKMDLVLPQEESGGARNGVRKRRDIARWMTSGLLLRVSPVTELWYRYLDPDPLLLVTRRGEANEANPRFHALNQAIVQLVR